MGKKRVVGLASAVLWIFLAGCGQTPVIEEEAVDSGNEIRTEAAENIGEPEEKQNAPRLFVNAPDAWVGDIMGQADDNGIHLNYLYETDYNGIAYHPIHRFTTKNLWEYTDEGEILPFSTDTDAPDLAIGTGSFFQAADGTYHCFYTGHNDLAPEQGKDRECVMHAVSDDNKRWVKVPEDTFYAPEGYSSDDFRDPFVFWDEQKNCYRMLIGARTEESKGGVIAEFTSADLKEWSVQEPFYEQEELYFMECPDLFKMGEWYYLLFSWNNVTCYRMSKSLDGPWEKPEFDTFDGNAFYAAKTVEYQGTRYLFGFIDRKKGGEDSLSYTWAGSVCPYELVQKPDGTLGATIPHQYEEDYFTKELALSQPEIIGNASAQDGTVTLNSEDGGLSGVSFGSLPQTMLFTCKVAFEGEGKGAGLAFGAGRDFSDAYGILFDREPEGIRFASQIACENAFAFSNNAEGMLAPSDEMSLEDGSSAEGISENCDQAETILAHYDKRYVGDMRTSAPDTASAFRPEAGQTFDLKVVVENEVIVLYLDQTKVLSNRIYKAPGNGWGLFALGGKAVFSDIRVFIPGQ